MENADTLFIEDLLVSSYSTYNNNIHAELKRVYLESINSIFSLYLQCLNLAENELDSINIPGLDS